MRKAIALEADNILYIAVGSANEASYIREITLISKALTFYIHV